MKKPRARIASLLLAFLLLLSIFPLTALPARAADPDITPAFTDPALLAAVRTTLRKQPIDPITAAECAAVRLLNLINKGIVDLSGMEYFTGLQTLDISRNPLTSADFSMLPALRALSVNENPLTSLNVAQNAQLLQLYCTKTNLTAVNVSQNTALQALYVAGNSNFSSLNLAGNPNLTTLECNNSALRSLDLSANPALLMLYCGNNPLSNLDLSGNPLLQVLSCENSQLATLDLSRNPKLFSVICAQNSLSALNTRQNPDLQALVCTENNITTLDLSANTKLTTLLCGQNDLTDLTLTANTALQRLDCYENELTALNLGDNTNLENLDCHGNQIAVLDVNPLTKLQLFNCSGNLLTALNISQNVQLRELRCAHNQLTTLNRTQNDLLMYLDISYNRLPSEAALIGPGYGTVIFEPQTPGGTDITAQFVDPNLLAAVRNALGKAENARITAEECAFVETLDLSGCGIANLAGLENFPRLKTLHCADNQLTSISLSAFPDLVTLDCSGNRLKSLSLSQNTHLLYLDCSRNQLSKLDLSKNTALETLYFADNLFAGLDLTQNLNLLYLDARNNYIADEYLDLVIPASVLFFEYSFVPQHVAGPDVSAAFADENFLAAIRTALGKQASNPIYAFECASLAALNVANKGIADLSGIEHFINLEHLLCDGNQLTSLNFSQNPNLKTLSCANNHLTALDLTANPLLTILSATKNFIPSESSITGFDAAAAALFAFAPQNAHTVTQATCDGQGFTTWVCSHDAPHTHTDQYSNALGHDYEPTVTAPSCTEAGHTTWVCSHDTTHRYTDTPVALTGHALGSWQVREAAGCETAGLEYRVCSVCGEGEETRPTAALGHECVSTVTPPTYTADGFTTHACKRCDYSYKDTYITKFSLPHDAAKELDYKITDYSFNTDGGKITWTSDNSKVLTVNANGSINYKGRGTTTVTAKDAAGNVVATTNVTVKYVWWQWLIVILLFGWIWY